VEEHALDGVLDELLVAHLLHVGGAHPLEDLAEQLQLPVSVGGVFLCRRELRHGDEEGGDHGRDLELAH
jgi:hypothetical protein